MGGGPRSTLDNQNEQGCSFHQAIENKSKLWVVYEGTPSTSNLFDLTFHCPSLAWLLTAGRISCCRFISCQAWNLNILTQLSSRSRSAHGIKLSTLGNTLSFGSQGYNSVNSNRISWLIDDSTRGYNLPALEIIAIIPYIHIPH